MNDITPSSSAGYLTFVVATGGNENNPSAVIKKYLITGPDGKRYNTNHYTWDHFFAQPIVANDFTIAVSSYAEKEDAREVVKIAELNAEAEWVVGPCRDGRD